VTSRSSQSDRRTSPVGSRALRIIILFAVLGAVALVASACSGYSADPSATALNSRASLAATMGSGYGSTDPTPTAATAASSSANSDPTQLKIKDIKIGKGSMLADPGRTVTLDYTGWLYDGGKKFGSSSDDGHPMKFTIGTNQVILGLDNGVVGMKVGGVRELIIPATFAYGEVGKGDVPPEATVKFRVTLLSIK
jgi:FKBP-type peptidyl-prolyl cis-trans isomerase FkpA